MGTYVHGILADSTQRTALLRRLGVVGSGEDYQHAVDQALDSIASALEQHLDMNALIELAATGALESDDNVAPFHKPCAAPLRPSRG